MINKELIIFNLFDLLNELEEILKMYADKDNYWTETKSCEFVSNGVTECIYNCTDNDPSEAIQGLEVLEKIKSQVKFKVK